MGRRKKEVPLCKIKSFIELHNRGLYPYAIMRETGLSERQVKRLYLELGLKPNQALRLYKINSIPHRERVAALPARQYEKYRQFILCLCKLRRFFGGLDLERRMNAISGIIDFVRDNA